MVDKLNELQHQLKAETQAVERERLKLSIDALTKAVKKSVREQNGCVKRRIENGGD